MSKVNFSLLSFFFGIMLISTAFSNVFAIEPPTCNVDDRQSDSGLIYCDENTSKGYVLFSPYLSTETYLVDHNGLLVKQWNSTGNISETVGIRLLPDGKLMRMGLSYDIRTNSSMNAGGASNSIEIINPDGSLFWNIQIANQELRLHHDALMLPNGNVLAIVWNYMSETQAISFGKLRDEVDSRGFWPDSIVELERTSTTTHEIVWMWNASDHLVQDIDSSLANFGNITDNIGKIDINGHGQNVAPGDPDWMHCNSIDYDQQTDQILLSCRNTEEIYIIDHSIRWNETSSSLGDLKYRFGNPSMYIPDIDNSMIHTVLQHDAQFFRNALNGEFGITYFSNGKKQVGYVIPEFDQGEYVISEGVYTPAGPIRVLNLPENWVIHMMSSAKSIDDNTFLVTNGPESIIVQISWDGQIFWDYRPPIGDGMITARESRGIASPVFHSHWIPQFDNRITYLQDFFYNQPSPLEIWTDNCPDENAFLFDSDRDGCIDDSDNDGVNDLIDICPETGENDQVNATGCYENPNPPTDTNNSTNVTNNSTNEPTNNSINEAIECPEISDIQENLSSNETIEIPNQCDPEDNSNTNDSNTSESQNETGYVDNNIDNLTETNDSNLMDTGNDKLVDDAGDDLGKNTGQDEKTNENPQLNGGESVLELRSFGWGVIFTLVIVFFTKRSFMNEQIDLMEKTPRSK